LRADNEGFLKLKMNCDIITDPKNLSKIVDRLEAFLASLSQERFINVNITTLDMKVPSMKYSIFDFECDYPKVLGVCISNTIYQVYMTEKNEVVRTKFFRAIYTVLSILRDFYIITFSNYESSFIYNTLYYELQKDDPKLDLSFFERLQLINVQMKHRTYEALIAAVISLSIEPYPDPILRDTKKMEVFFEDQQFDLILTHNISCLINSLYVLFFRFFRQNLALHEVTISPSHTITYFKSHTCGYEHRSKVKPFHIIRRWTDTPA